MRKLPAAPATVYKSRWEQFTLWFSMNRAPLGRIFAALSAIVLAMSFESHAHVAAILSSLALIISSGTAGGGQWKSDDFHEERVNEIVRERSGAYPVPYPYSKEEKHED